MPLHSNKKIITSIYTGLLILLGLILLLGVIVVMGFYSQNWVTATTAIRSDLFELNSEIKESERNRDRYILSGLKEYRRNYDKNLKFINAKLVETNDNFEHSKEQSQNINRLQLLLSKKETENSKAFQDFERDNTFAYETLFLDEIRKSRRDSIEVLFETMLAENTELYKNRQNKFDIFYYASILLLISGIAFMVYGLLRIKGQLIPVFDHINNANELLNAQIQQKEAEILLKENQREINEQLIEQLKDKNQELNQFAYIASHDLQEPLRTVDNFIVVFEEEYGDKLDEDAHTYFNFIKGATTRMRNLINGLLQYSRIGRSGELEPVDLNAIVAEIEKDLAQKISDTEASIFVNKLPTVEGYTIELKQLFFNLIGNALKFVTPDRKPVITIGCYESDNNYQITVTDNGIGIQEKYLSKIFDMFTRLHSETLYDGQGIGLAFCKKITELHNGIIHVESEEGKGTTFLVILKKGK
ncbi:sensor histidine kinase [Rasiella sp. SM2506]|uniref:sensor histidine kinase n=1 Tax=Rasiella sp. SM2506 TaxID=3423914 RepID=UPI003D7AE290